MWAPSVEIVRKPVSSRGFRARPGILPAVKKTCIDGLYYWSRFQPDREIDFNGFYWARPKGGVLFDPLDLGPAERAALDLHGGARWIVLTNFDHLRAAPDLARELSLEVLAPAEERARFGDAAGAVDGWYTAAAGLPEELGIEAVELTGGKSPVEMALYLRPLEVLLFGDLVRSHASGRLMLLPDAKLADRERVVAGLRPLTELAKRAVCLGDGDSIWYRADEAYSELVSSL